ncbi:MAG: GTPase domain-containing protein [Deltaproteobacteria bacterium]|nr:GTPase domain-containing protein [Deltaproteobacteria bacterium]
MASVNPHTRELVFKLVFYGPGLGGKTTTLQYIHAATKAEHRGKMVSLATPTDRTLYFDFLPIRVPRVRGMAVRLQLFTVPGQVYYAATRKLVLSGADGVVFVADSQQGRIDTNQESLDDLHANLGEHNRRLEEVPHTFHWNKRDLTDLVTTEELDRRFNKFGAPSLGTVATKGDGVFEGLERITRLVLKSYENDPKVRIEATADPKGGELATAVSEDGVVQALRELEHRGGGATPSPAPATSDADMGAPSFESPTKISHTLPDGSRPPPVGTPPPPRAMTDAPRSPRAPIPSPRPPEARTPSSDKTPSERARETKSDSGRAGSLPFSLCDLWPESERESVKQAEAMIAARDAVNAALACDVLVTRVLASAAGLVGTLDAPRDPAVVSLLLGLDGPRYLQFRTTVRAARHREAVTMRDALECFAFALEARRARELLRRER